MVFMVYTMVLTFMYPTLASAMTGYSANVEAFVNTTEGDYIRFSSFAFAYFVIHDGWRVQLGGDHGVTSSTDRNIGNEIMVMSSFRNLTGLEQIFLVISQ